MSEGNIPEVNVTPDVEEAPKALNENVEDLKAQEVAEEVADKAEEAPQVVENANEGGEEAVQAEEGGEIPADLGSLSLAELSDMFDKLSQADDRMKRYKEAEAIKSAFYKKLSKEKAEAGFGAKVDEPSSREDVIDEVAPAAQTEEVKGNPFEAMETAFKGVYANYKKERAEYNRQQDAQREENFARKQAVIEDLKNLVEKQEDVNSTFPAFRELQKLHEQWKEFGPVAKEYRDSIWDRFKAATAVINKKYQAYFEGQKEKQQENLAEKTKLCEQVEAIAGKEVKSSNEWNALSTEIEDIQKKWRTIGFATRKENQKIYDRFRAACDKFFSRKREYYTQFKDSMNENMEKKLSLIEQAEALKDSKEWKKTTEALIALQKQWKEIGAVPRKKSEQLWKRFRAACDEFFNERDKNAKPENDFHGNLKAKKALIEEINEYVLSGDAAADRDAARAFADKWQGIGFVPFKEKESIQAAYTEAMQAKFPDFSLRAPRQGAGNSGRNGGFSRKPLSEKDRLVQQYNKLQQDIDTYENNIGFFSSSKNSAPLIQKMQERIDAAKQELKDLEAKIRKAEESEEEK